MAIGRARRCSRSSGRCARLLPVGFYYKSMIRPRWRWPPRRAVIRSVAGLGPVPRDLPVANRERLNHHPDLLVIGGGVAGLAAALAAAAARRERRCSPTRAGSARGRAGPARARSTSLRRSSRARAVTVWSARPRSASTRGRSCRSPRRTCSTSSTRAHRRRDRRRGAPRGLPRQRPARGLARARRGAARRRARRLARTADRRRPAPAERRGARRDARALRARRSPRVALVPGELAGALPAGSGARDGVVVEAARARGRVDCESCVVAAPGSRRATMLAAPGRRSCSPVARRSCGDAGWTLARRERRAAASRRRRAPTAPLPTDARRPRGRATASSASARTSRRRARAAPGRGLPLDGAPQAVHHRDDGPLPGGAVPGASARPSSARARRRPSRVSAPTTARARRRVRSRSKTSRPASRTASSSIPHFTSDTSSSGRRWSGPAPGSGRELRRRLSPSTGPCASGVSVMDVGTLGKFLLVGPGCRRVPRAPLPLPRRRSQAGARAATRCCSTRRVRLRRRPGRARSATSGYYVTFTSRRARRRRGAGCASGPKPGASTCTSSTRRPRLAQSTSPVRAPASCSRGSRAIRSTMRRFPTCGTARDHRGRRSLSAIRVGFVGELSLRAAPSRARRFRAALGRSPRGRARISASGRTDSRRCGSCGSRRATSSSGRTPISTRRPAKLGHRLGRQAWKSLTSSARHCSRAMATSRASRALGRFDVRRRSRPGRGSPVRRSGKHVGHLTSSRFSPILGKGVALGWVEHRAGDEPIAIDGSDTPRGALSVNRRRSTTRREAARVLELDLTGGS